MVARPPVFESMSKKVLVADDNPSIRHALRALLAQHGYPICIEAVDGVDAVQKVAWSSPNLVVLDYLMPRMNGIVAATAIRSRLPKVPIILISLYGPDAVLAAAAGINAVVSKEESMIRLPELIKELVRKR